MTETTKQPESAVAVGSTRLLACPHCGYWRPTLHENTAVRFLRWFVACTNCLMRGPAMGSNATASAAWNDLPRHANNEVRHGATTKDV